MSSLGKRKQGGTSIGERFRTAQAGKKRMVAKAPSRQIEAAVKKAINKEVEQKFLDVPLSFTNVTNTVSTNDDIVLLNPIQEGTGQENRAGNKVRLHSVRVRTEISNTYTPVLPNNAMSVNRARVILLWDKDGGGQTIPAFNNIFSEVLQDGSVQSNIDSLILPANNARYRILRDEMINFGSLAANQIENAYDNGNATGFDTVTLAEVAESKWIDWYVPLKNDMFTTRYNGTAAPLTSASIINGALYMIIRSRENNGALGVVGTLGGSVRLRFTDM